MTIAKTVPTGNILEYKEYKSARGYKKILLHLPIMPAIAIVFITLCAGVIALIIFISMHPLMCAIAIMAAFVLFVLAASAAILSLNSKFPLSAVRDAKQKAIKELTPLKAVYYLDGTVYFGYDCINVDKSTIDTLHLDIHPDMQAECALKKPLRAAVQNYAKNEKPSDAWLVERVSEIHRAKQHEYQNTVNQLESQLYQNTTRPVDTPYYKAMRERQAALKDESKILDGRHKNLLHENDTLIDGIMEIKTKNDGA